LSSRTEVLIARLEGWDGVEQLVESVAGIGRERSVAGQAELPEEVVQPDASSTVRAYRWSRSGCATASGQRAMTCTDGANRAPQAGACQEPALWLEEFRTTTATRNDVVAVANIRRHIDRIRMATYIAGLPIQWWAAWPSLPARVISGHSQNTFQGARPALARTDPDG
jgi:hypothetical protein